MSREWSWEQSLAGTEADAERDHVIRRILFDLVRDHCSELGLRVGESLRCRRQSPDEVVVELESGALRTIEREYAWFVQVEPAPAGGRRRPSPSTDRDIDPADKRGGGP